MKLLSHNEWKMLSDDLSDDLLNALHLTEDNLYDIARRIGCHPSWLMAALDEAEANGEKCYITLLEERPVHKSGRPKRVRHWTPGASVYEPDLDMD